MSYRPKDTKERVLHRLRIAQGHLKRVVSMVNDDRYCIDIIHQSQAIQSALKEVDNLVMEAHLNGCVADAIQNGRKDEAITEILQVFKKRNP